MIETLTALFFAHVLADFVLQTGWMVNRKRNPVVLVLHAAIVLGTAMAATGQGPVPALLALAALHLAIDVVKTWGAGDGAAAFLSDQAAHLATLAGVAHRTPVMPSLRSVGRPWSRPTTTRTSSPAKARRRWSCSRTSARWTCW